jgi:alanine racemase
MKTSRRTVLKMGPALAAAGWASTTASTVSAAVQDSSFDPWVEVHPDNVRHNVGEIRRRVSGRPILAVIKNNGYGSGVDNIARILDPLSEIEAVAVVKLQEAMVLRDAGIKKPILLMGPFTDKELEDVVARDIMPMIYTPVGDTLDRISSKLQKRIPLHICVDTGMGRVGVPYREAASLIKDLAGRESIQVEGVMTTLAEDKDGDKEQVRLLQSLCSPLEAEGAKLGRKHATSSFALFENPDTFMDMVRPGLSIFGVYSEQHFRTMNVVDLRVGMSLKCRVVYVKKLLKGDSAGYGRAYVAKEDVWVATLPVGHTDGWPRIAANGAKVRIGERLYPVIAAVSASHCIIELGAQTNVKAGDIAILFDWQDGSRPEDVSAACEASVYNLTMHLNPLLPKKVL